MSVIEMFRQCEHRDSRHPVDLSIRSWSKAVKSSSKELPMRKFVLGFSVGVLTFPAAFVLLAWLGLFPALANAEPPKMGKSVCTDGFECLCLATRTSPQQPRSSDRRKFIGWHEDI
jgi:hypothetical protein